MMTQRQINLVFSGVILSLIFMVVAFAAFHPRKPVPMGDPREVREATRFMADLYPGRRFRIVWNEGRDGWRTGFAIPLDEPRFSPIQIECPTDLNMGTAPCHLIH